MKKFLYLLLMTATLMITGCDKTKEAAKSAADSAKEMATDAVDATKEAASGMTEGAKDMATDASDAVKKAVKDDEG